MTEAPSVPDLLPGGEDAAAAPERRWLIGIILTTVLNLAVTATAFGGLWLQGSSVGLERDRAVTDQLTSASELIREDNFTAQAVGFRALERVAQISPDDQDYVVDLAESYLVAESYKPDEQRPAVKVVSYYEGGAAYVPNPAIQAAVNVIRSRKIERDPGGPGQRVFQLSGMVVEAARLHGVVMRNTRGESCYGRFSVWDEAKLGGSDFTSCGFLGAQFVGSELKGVQFGKAHLTQANFTNADLANARFDEATFDSATVFRGADLSRATFANTDLSTADFTGVKSIAGADFSRAKGVEKAQNLRNAQGNESAHWPWSQ